MPVVKCARCKTFINKDKAFKRGIQSFCKEPCKNVNKSVKKKHTKKKDISDVLRKRVICLDGSRCRSCRGASGLPCNVHHIFYRSEGGPHEESNLITLCVKCHDVVHSDKKRFQKLCLGVVWLRSVYGDKQTTILDVERKMHERT